MTYQMGFVPTMYVSEVICENRNKRQRSAKRNYERTVYEFAENDNLESFEVMLDDEMRKISGIDRYACRND